MRKREVDSKSILVVLCLSTGAVAVVANAQSVVEHKGEGWCLSFDREQVTLATENPVANRPTPVILVPSDVPTASILDVAAATGWTVRYTKTRTGAFTNRPVDDCGATTPGNGLIRFRPKTYAVSFSPDPCPGLAFKELFLPKASDPLPTQVRISYDVTANVRNCRMVDRSPNGWEAEIILPKTHLNRRRDASTHARAYFDTYLTDCGGKDEP